VILNELGASFEGVSMGLWPTHRDESALLRFIDSKQVTRNQEIVPRDNSLWPTLRCLQFGQTKS
jgi:hypothetical protein